MPAALPRHYMPYKVKRQRDAHREPIEIFFAINKAFFGSRCLFLDIYPYLCRL